MLASCVIALLLLLAHSGARRNYSHRDLLDASFRRDKFRSSYKNRFDDVTSGSGVGRSGRREVSEVLQRKRVGAQHTRDGIDAHRSSRGRYRKRDDAYMDDEHSLSIERGMYASLLQARSAVSGSAKIPIPTSQRSALEDLWKALDGPIWEYGNAAKLGRAWDVYNSSSDPCIDEWYGIGCSCNGKESHYKFDDDTPHYYYKLFDDDTNSTYPLACNLTHIVLHTFYGIDLSGQIPESIGSISTLQQLLLSGESLDGELPSSIGNLTALEYLAIIHSSVLGAVPDSIGSLRRLRYFSLYNSKFTSLPDTIGGLQSLNVTWLSLNQFTQLPDSIADLVNLQRLYLDNNQLMEVPSLAGLVNLQHLSLYSNQLTEVPHGIANLTALVGLGLGSNLITEVPSLADLVNLQHLALYSNQLTEVPHGIANLTALVELNLGSNLITEVPASLFSRLSNLNVLWLNSNQLTELPLSLSQLSNLREFYADSNYLREFPDLSDLQHLGALRLYSNRLSSFPQADWKNLSFLDVRYNNISTNLDFIIGMTSIKGLFIENNKLTGSIPDELYDFKHLEYFSAGRNRLSGTINHRFSTAFEGLVYWDVSDNQLSGALPSLKSTYVANAMIIKFAGNRFTGGVPVLNCSSEASRLYLLDLHDNQLSGEIGSSLFNCMNIKYLDLSQNRLSGSLPNRFDMLPSLVGLYLNNNSLTSSLPSSLSRLHSLEELWLHGNGLTGPVPSLQSLQSLHQLFLQSNQLSGGLGFVSAANNSQLETVDLSNNMFDGLISTDLLSLGLLRSFAASRNCLHIELTAAVCNGNSSLETLILDGIYTSESCRENLMLHVIDQAYGSTQSVTGLPGCLFNLPSLQVLHLSGNGIEGSLSESLELSPSLHELILSYNQLRGAIPMALQRHPWTVLDLSHNKLSGTLVPDLNVSRAISLDVNRLSGAISSSLYSIPTVSVLDGNIFDCDSSDLQGLGRDPSSDKYSCGSDSVNNTVISWAVLLVLIVAPLLATQLIPGVSQKGSALVAAIQQARSRASALLLSALDVDGAKLKALDPSIADIDTANISDFAKFLVGLRRVCVAACAVIILVYMPVYLSLSAYYRQYESSYIYVCSIAYLSGVAPGAVLFVFMAGGLAMIRLKMLGFYSRGNREKSRSAIWLEEKSIYNAVLLLLSTANIVVVSAVNVGYIYYLQTSGSQTALAIVMAMFKVFWTTFVVPKVFDRVQQAYMARHSAELLIDSVGDSLRLLNESLARKNALYVSLISILNNVVIPCFVVVFQSSKCLQETISVSSDVSALYSATYSSLGISAYFSRDEKGVVHIYSDEILSEETLQVTTSFQPPFSYSYECSSTMLVSFAQVFLYQCIFVTFVKPAVQYALIAVYSRNFSRLYSILSKVDLLPSLVLVVLDDEADRTMQEGDNSGEGDKEGTAAAAAAAVRSRKVVFRARAFLSEVFTMVALLMSFGLTFPPLALTLTVAIVSTTYKTQLEMGFYLSRALEHGSAERIRQLNSSLENIIGSFLSSLKMAYAFTTVFLAFFILDIFGDEVGYEMSLAPAILLLVLSAAIYLSVSLSTRYVVRMSAAKGGFVLERIDSELNVELSVYRKNRKETRAMTYIDNPMRAPNRPRLSRQNSGTIAL